MINYKKRAVVFIFSSIILIALAFAFNPELALKLYSNVRYGSSISFDGNNFKLKDGFYILFKREQSYAIKNYESSRKAVVLTQSCPNHLALNECLNNLKGSASVVFQNQECLIFRGKGEDTSYLVINISSGLSVFTSDTSEVSINELKNYCAVTVQ